MGCKTGSLWWSTREMRSRKAPSYKSRLQWTRVSKVMSGRILLILACGTAFAQQGFLRPSGLVRAYTAPSVPPVKFQNSERIFALIRAGQIYLSLQDAIALALENNLDIELERFLPKIADADVERAQGGGLLRGLSLFVNEPPPGIGGPSGPLLTNLTAGSTPAALVNTNFSDIALISQQQSNLSVTDPTAIAKGP